MGDSNELPRGWVSASIEDLTEFVTSGSRGWAKYYSAEGPFFLRVGNLDRGRIELDLEDVARVRPPLGAEGRRTRVEAHDILISITADIGMVGLIPENFEEAYINQHVALIRPLRPMNSRAMAYSLLDPAGLQKLARKSQYGATKPGLSLIQVRQFPVVVPPLDEQARIVEAIETLFTKLDAAVASLKRVQANLKRYCASVLKAAVEGRLVPTEAELARREGREYEPASKLLERILAERRRRWEVAELARMRAKGKEPKNEKWKSKYKEPARPDISVLDELPEGWCWTTVDVVGNVLLGRRRAPEYKGPLRPYLRVANIKDDWVDLSHIKTMPYEEMEALKYQLQPGDILVSEGQSPERIGQSAMYQGGVKDLCFQSSLHRFRPVAHKLSSKYAQLVFRSHVRTGLFRKYASITTNIAHLVLRRFKQVPFPLPPMFEQKRIASQVENLLGGSTVIERQISKQLQLLNRLRQAILKWAFEGKLVDQDPNDEPASSLLDRIRAERKAKYGRQKAQRLSRPGKDREADEQLTLPLRASPGCQAR